MRPWWHLSFGGERRPVEFPHGKSISLPRRATYLADSTPHAPSALSRTKPRNRYLSGAELIVRIQFPPADSPSLSGFRLRPRKDAGFPPLWRPCGATVSAETRKARQHRAEEG